jgi:hypothetical protein
VQQRVGILDSGLATIHAVRLQTLRRYEERRQTVCFRQYPKRKFNTCRRYNVPGDAHSLTFTWYHRRAFRSKDRTCQGIADAIASARMRWEFDLTEAIHAEIKYIPANPVRRGPVAKPEDWRW